MKCPTLKESLSSSEVVHCRFSQGAFTTHIYKLWNDSMSQKGLTHQLRGREGIPYPPEDINELLEDRKKDVTLLTRGPEIIHQELLRENVQEERGDMSHDF